MAKIKDHQIKEIFGGLGSTLGDEGSGYFFGKMLLQKYFHSDMSDKLKLAIEDQLGTRDLILQKVYGPEGKKFISSMSKTFAEFEEKELKELHYENVGRFMDLYLPKGEKSKIIYFIGSYASFNKENISILLQMRGLELGGVIEKPIEPLTEYLLKATF